jgi:hypothetical protein
VRLEATARVSQETPPPTIAGSCPLFLVLKTDLKPSVRMLRHAQSKINKRVAGTRPGGVSPVPKSWHGR